MSGIVVITSPPHQDVLVSTLLFWVLVLAAYSFVTPLGERLMVRSRVRVITAWAAANGRQVSSVSYRPRPGMGFLLGPVTLLVPRYLSFQVRGRASGVAFDETVAVSGFIRRRVVAQDR